MKTWTAVCALVVLTSPVFAADWLPLPQSLRDLLPVSQKSDSPSVNHVKIDVPADRLVKAPEKSADILRLSPGQSQTVSLDRDAASVIVGNPAHASVFLDNARLLVVMPRASGATSFTVLDKNGDTILTKQIVVSEKDDAAYVRVTRICDVGGTGSGGACQPATVYYCPDNCVPVSVPGVDPAASMPAMPPVSGVPMAAASPTVPTPAAANGTPVAQLM